MSLKSEFLSILLQETYAGCRKDVKPIKLDIKTEDGLEFHFEKPPMSKERFETICFLVGILGSMFFFSEIMRLLFVK